MYGLMGLIQILLIIGKVANVPYVGDLSWWVVFIPTYFALVRMLAIFTIAFVIAFLEEK